MPTPLTTEQAIRKAELIGQINKWQSIGEPMKPIVKDPWTQNMTGTTGTTWPVPWSASSVLWGLSAEDPIYAQLNQDALNAYNTPINEEEIKANKLKEYQAQLDALQTVQNDELNKYRIQAQQRSGQASIIQGARGLAGSNVGTAMDNTVTQSNNEIEAAVLAQQALARQAIYGEVRKGAQEEIANKLAAKKAGWEAYLTYIKWESERKSTRNKEVAKRLISSKSDPSQLTDADWKDLESKGYSKQDILAEYQDMKAQADAAQATADAEANTMNLNNQKTQAEINKINSDASRNYEEGWYVYNSKGELIAQVVGKNYEAGGRIYESGTNKYIGDARSVSGGGGGNANVNVPWTVVNAKIGNKTVSMNSTALAGLQNAMANMPWAIIGSTGRSHEEQAKLYEAYQNGTGGLAAPPWTSKHEDGLGVDLYGGTWPDGKLLPPTPQMIQQMEANWFKWMNLPWDAWHFEHQWSGNTTASSKWGKQIPTTVATNLSDAKYFPTLLSDLETLISSNKDMFDPIKWLYYAANPYETWAQSVEDDLKRATQLVGKFMEGGVLRAEDEKKYAKMLPKLTDSYDVAQNKLAGVRKMLADKYNGYLTDYANSGYDVSNFTQVSNGSSPTWTGNTWSAPTAGKTSSGASFTIKTK